jgi:hypothetical protein
MIPVFVKEERNRNRHCNISRLPREAGRAGMTEEREMGLCKWRERLTVIQSDESVRMHPVTRTAANAFKNTPVYVMDNIMAELMNSGLSVLETAEDWSMKQAWNMKCMSSLFVPYNMKYMLI